MPSVFTYNDYRTYLADYYAEKKRQTPSFSYQNFSRKAGFTSKSFVFNVIHGRKNLSRSSVLGVSEALGLSRTEAEYFQNLVFFNQAPTYKERQHYFERLSGVRSTGGEAGRARRIRQDQYEFYSKWYYAAVRSLVDMFPFSGDYAWLARAVSPAIRTAQARKAVALLVRLGLIERRKNGVYRVTNRTITTGPEVTSLAVLNLHLDMMKLAASAVSQRPRTERNVTGLLLGISHKTYEAICEETRRFQEHILAMAEQDNRADRVYQFNFHLFPLSRTDLKEQS